MTALGASLMTALGAGLMTALGAGLMTPPSTRPEVCPARTEPRPPFVDVAAYTARCVYCDSARQSGDTTESTDNSEINKL
jgi:hypothetical protein